MAKLFEAVLILCAVAFAVCNATPAKLNNIRTSKNRLFARQEVAEDVPAQTPYPPAGVRPEVPFNLPTEEKLLAPANHYLPPLADAAMFYSAPAEVYGPPAEFYGPPEVSDEDLNSKSIPESPEAGPEEEIQTEAAQTEETVTEETATKETDLVQQPEENQQGTGEDEPESDVSEPEEDNFIPERLVLTKSTSTIRAAKLKQLTPLTQRTNKAQQFYLINGSVYTVA